VRDRRARERCGGEHGRAAHHSLPITPSDGTK
jgi:hypothetical protein